MADDHTPVTCRSCEAAIAAGDAVYVLEVSTVLWGSIQSGDGRAHGSAFSWADGNPQTHCSKACLRKTLAKS